MRTIFRWTYSDESGIEGDHRAKRKLRKKLARQLVRRRNAQLRDQNSEKVDIVTEEEVARILAEEELEKQRHDEEERKWIVRERIAQELFAQKKTLEEAQQEPKQEILKIALTEKTVIQTLSPQPSEQKLKHDGWLLSEILQGNDPTSVTLLPNHCPEPPHLNWKREELCQFFWKTGACRYGDRCSRQHPLPPLHSSDIASFGLSHSNTPRLILIIENMFNHFSLQCDPLEVDETQLLIDYRDFYADVRPELENICGGPLEIFRCCRNALPHLRGNVYIQFTQHPTIASDIALRLSSRLYDGKQLVARLAYLGEGWESAICGNHGEAEIEVILNDIPQDTEGIQGKDIDTNHIIIRVPTDLHQKTKGLLKTEFDQKKDIDITKVNIDEVIVNRDLIQITFLNPLERIVHNKFENYTTPLN
ncbi:hypothetical protein ACTXT7_006779 [Hymenolepis weldensis]